MVAILFFLSMEEPPLSNSVEVLAYTLSMKILICKNEGQKTPNETKNTDTWKKLPLVLILIYF